MKQATVPRTTFGFVVCCMLAIFVAFPAVAVADTVLTVWILDSNDQVHQVWDNEWIPEFEVLHPGIKVEWEKVSWSALNDKLAVSTAAGIAPDIFQAGAEYRAVLAENGFARPIDDFLESWPEWQDFVPSTWETVVWRGQSYGVPAVTTPRTIVFNKAIFSEVGLPPEPPVTWEDLRNIALRINRTNEDDMFTRLGIEARKAAAGLHFVLPFFLQNEVEMFTPDGRQAAFNTPAGVETLEFLADLSQNVSPVLRTQLMSSDVTVNFLERRTGMMYGGPGIFVNAQQHDPSLIQDIGVAPPLTNKVQAGVTYTDWWAISAISPNAEEAFEFIKFLSEPERLRRYNEMIGSIPPRNEAITGAWIEANPGLALYAELVLPHVKAYFSSQHAHQMNSIFGRVLSQTMDGYIAPTVALERAAAEYDALYK